MNFPEDYIMNLTLCGCLCIFLMAVLLKHCKLKVYMLPTMPLFMILISYWRYFSTYEHLNLSLGVDLLLFYSFICFLAFYAVGKRLKLGGLSKGYISLIDSYRIQGNFFTLSKTLRLYLAIVILYCIYDLWINTLLYGSLESALIRFYGKPVESDLPSMLKTSLQFYYKVVVVFLFVFRFFLNANNKSSKYIYVALILLVLIAIPRGSRGAVASPFVMLITADMFSATYFKCFSLIRRMKTYLWMVGGAVVIMLMLTVIRNIDFEDVRQLHEAVSEIKLSEASDKYEEGEGELLLSDVQFCIENFGTTVPFLSPFYTLKTIIFAPIPRVLWPSKPVSFGYVLNEVKLGGRSLDPQVLNYPGAVGWAAGYAGEGWANGGLFGITFYSILFGLLSGICAKMYYILFSRNTPISILIAMLFFYISVGSQRGDMLSAWALTVYPLLIITFILIAFKMWKSLCSYLRHVNFSAH